MTYWLLTKTGRDSSQAGEPEQKAVVSFDEADQNAEMPGRSRISLLVISVHA